MFVSAGMCGALYSEKTKCLSTSLMPLSLSSPRANGRYFVSPRPGVFCVSRWLDKCYESFTLNALLFAGVLRTFARVMIGRQPISSTATAGVFALGARSRPTSFAARRFSAHNVLSSCSNC